jgi:hypothetical protein
MPPKSRKNRVAGKMTLEELMHKRHTPLDAPSNEFKDEMDFNDDMNLGQPLALDDLHVSHQQSNLRESVLNVNLDEMLREINVLLHTSSSSKPNLKWVDALDQLYHDFLHRSKLEPPVYHGSPSLSQVSNISADSHLRKRPRPNTGTRSKRPQIMMNQWTNNTQLSNPVPKHRDLQNPEKTQISPHRNITQKRKERPFTGSDIEFLTRAKRSQSSSGFSNNSKGSMHLSELNSI